MINSEGGKKNTDSVEHMLRQTTKKLVSSSYSTARGETPVTPKILVQGGRPDNVTVKIDPKEAYAQLSNRSQ